MPVITAKVPLAGGATSGWSATDNLTQIVVGVEGNNYQIEYNLGSTLTYQAIPAENGNPQTIIIAKANQVRVKNLGTSSLNYEVFS